MSMLRRLFSFSSLGVTPLLIKPLEKLSITTPTAIQSLSIPALLSGKDVILASETGSGKTLAYLLPIVQGLLCTPPPVPNPDKKNSMEKEGEVVVSSGRLFHMGKWPRAIIMVPTKELCAQVLGMLKPLIRGTHLRAAVLTGESLVSDLILRESVEADSGDLAASRPNKNRPEIVILTPRCLLYNLSAKNRKMEAQFLVANTAWLVFDEGDLLFSSNEKLIDQIITSFRSRDKAVKKNKEFSSIVGNKTNYCFVAATLPSIESKSMTMYVNRFLPDAEILKTVNLHKINSKINHIFHEIELEGLLESAQPSTNTNFFPTKEEEMQLEKKIFNIKLPKLKELLNTDKRTIIFVNQASAAMELGKAIEEFSPTVCCKLIDSNTRIQNLVVFQRSECNLLICTDLAARGIDFKNVERIVQFDFSQDVSSYIHRSGRAIRQGGSGEVISFFTAHDRMAIPIKNMLVESNSDVSSSLLAQNANRGLDTLFSRKRGVTKRLREKEKNSQTNRSKESSQVDNYLNQTNSHISKIKQL